MKIYLVECSEYPLSTFEELLRGIYKNVIDCLENKLSDGVEKSRVREYEEAIDIMKNEDFKIFFIELGLETLEKIRYASVSKHTNKCIIRAVFDILFKFCVDEEFKVPYLCCDTDKFKELEFDILGDLQYKIL